MYAKIEGVGEGLRISTFGIGHYFDDQLIKVLAKRGRGSASRIYDLN